MKISTVVEEQIRLILNDNQHGAFYLAKKALDIMTLASEEHIGENPKDMLKSLWYVGDKLMETRPSMSAPIIHAVTKLWESVYTEFLSNPAICPLKGWIREKKNQLVKQMDKAVEDSAKHTVKLIDEGETIFTFSYSSSVMEAMKYTASKKIKIIVAESRPLCEGVTTAEECAKLGIETALITDAQMGLFIKNCSLVLVGADAIIPSGDVINKAGTSIVALIAAASDIPFHVISTTWKIHPNQSVSLEEKSPEEIIKGSHPFSIRNIYFDITPFSKITSIITEKGSLHPTKISSLSANIQKSYKSFLSNPLSK